MWWTWFFAIGALLSALSVGVGAFGAHALKGRLSIEDLAIFDTASRYLTTQSLGLIGIALCMARLESLPLKISATAILVGTIIFCGTLFALVATGLRWWGAVTPIGGVLLIIGWITAAYACLKVSLQQ
jgi:uncharacterized membrane protein YgdD (TMEM256/DUF423 family)